MEYFINNTTGEAPEIYGVKIFGRFRLENAEDVHWDNDPARGLVDDTVVFQARDGDVKAGDVVRRFNVPEGYEFLHIWNVEWVSELSDPRQPNGFLKYGFDSGYGLLVSHRISINGEQVVSIYTGEHPSDDEAWVIERDGVLRKPTDEEIAALCLSALVLGKELRLKAFWAYQRRHNK